MTVARTGLEMPRTETPLALVPILVSLAVLGGVLLYALLGFWGVVVLFVVLAATTGIYTETVPGFFASVVLNHLTGRQRVLFQGMNFKLPWETPEIQVDLRVDLKEVCEETYASMDALMKVRYVYTIRTDVSGDDAGSKVILFSSYQPDAIRMAGRALFSMLLSDYYASRSGESLLNKGEINRGVFGASSDVARFETEHGVKVTVRLDGSEFDEKAQRFRDMVSGARSLDQAIQKLVEGGMNRAAAERVAKLMNLKNVSERDLNINVHSPDFQKLRNFTEEGWDETNGGKK